MTVPNTLLSFEEYLSLECNSNVRHEFVDGQTYAMTGGTLRHNVITNNIYSLLNSHLKGGGCRVYKSDVKVRAEAANCVYYPDVVVSCASFEADGLFAFNPILIVEVISPSTSVIDRREKRTAYLKIESLQEYLIVHQKRKRIQLFHRIDETKWETITFSSGSNFKLTAFPNGSITVSLDSVYETLDYPSETSPSVEEDESDYISDGGDEDW